MPSNMPGHYRKIRNILIITLFLNWLVALAKILYGLFSQSSSITADGFHSLSDGTSNIIGIIGIAFAAQPKDQDHPYGHKKYETLFSLWIAALLFVLAFNLAKGGINRLHHPVAIHVDALSFILMLATLAINFCVMRYEHKKGKELQSDFLISDAMHTKADIFTSASVILTLALVKAGWPILDPLVTIVISVFIAHAGYEIIQQSSKVLCDSAAILEVKRIEEIVLGIKGVLACHKIRTRGRPDDVHADLHVQISPDTRMQDAHQISFIIEERLKKEIPEITDVVVHLEPKKRV